MAEDPKPAPFGTLDVDRLLNADNPTEPENCVYECPRCNNTARWEEEVFYTTDLGEARVHASTDHSYVEGRCLEVESRQ